ncbi:MAG: hypothetical protein ABR886_01050 [Dehalococcoidales bacterium]|jgi:hypothetical protein
MAEIITWLQAQVTKADWDKINERRLKLNLKWSDLLLPATNAYLAQLETDRLADTTTRQSPATPKSKKRAKKARAEVKAEDERGEYGNADSAGQVKLH